MAEGARNSRAERVQKRCTAAGERPGPCYGRDMTSGPPAITADDFDPDVVDEGEEIIASARPAGPEDFAMIADGVAKQGFDHPSGGPYARELAAYIRWRGGLEVDADVLGRPD